MGQSRSALTRKQIECLRLVARQMTSKEIARELGVSPYTIDQRLDAARQKLGASSRREAARKFMFLEQAGTSETSIYDPSGIAKDADLATFVEPVSGAELFAAEDSGNRRFVGPSEKTEHKTQPARLLPPIGGHRHNLTNFQISKSILLIAFLSMICLSGLVLLVLGLMEVLK